MGIFSRKKGRRRVQLLDFEGQPLKAGDHVMSMRYELGECKIIDTDSGMVYKSLSTGEQVSFAKMIDAASGNQKVKRLES